MPESPRDQPGGEGGSLPRGPLDGEQAPILQWALERRGLTDPAAIRAFLDPAYYSPASPYDFPGMPAAVGRLHQALHTNETILVWGDFDVDGQTSTALLVGGLRRLGGEASYHVPVRALEGHGVSPDVLRARLAAFPRPGLVLTCDTGVGAFEAVETAHRLGWDVIITDHHETPPPNALGQTFPPALAVITPHRLPPGRPLASLPGVGVAYKLLEALSGELGRPEAASAQLDLVALGIVADVAQQVGDTRYLLQLGLQCLRQTTRLGLQAIYNLAEVNPSTLDEQTIGFVLGPRLNALGRLGDANPAVELLITTDPAQAQILAAELENVNARRRLLTRQTMQSAAAMLRREPALADLPALMLHHPDWEAGVVGIAAGRLAELYGRPAVMMTGGQEAGGLVRGSIRAGGPVDVTAALRACADVLVGFGGHAAAAGFSLLLQDLPVFRLRFAQAVGEQAAALDDAPLEETYAYPLTSFSQAQRGLAEDIARLAPFGAGNPPPGLRIEGVRLLGRSSIGRSQEHVALNVRDPAGETARVLWWGGADMIDAAQDTLAGGFDLTFTLRPAPERGPQAVRLEYVQIRPGVAEEAPAAAEAERLVVDLRQAAQPLGRVMDLWQGSSSGLSADEWLFFTEGQDKARLLAAAPVWQPHAAVFCTRGELRPCHTLVVWSMPPGAREWQAMLSAAQPQTLVLVGARPEWTGAEQFLTRLAGMVKFAVAHHNGFLDLERLAAALGQRQVSVQRGLEWLAAMGNIQLWRVEGNWYAALGDGASPPDLPKAAKLHSYVIALLEETAAFRRAWMNLK